MPSYFGTILEPEKIIEIYKKVDTKTNTAVLHIPPDLVDALLSNPVMRDHFLATRKPDLKAKGELGYMLGIQVVRSTLFEAPTLVVSPRIGD